MMLESTHTPSTTKTGIVFNQWETDEVEIWTSHMDAIVYKKHLGSLPEMIYFRNYRIKLKEEHNAMCWRLSHLTIQKINTKNQKDYKQKDLHGSAGVVPISMGEKMLALLYYETIKYKGYNLSP